MIGLPSFWYRRERTQPSWSIADMSYVRMGEKGSDVYAYGSIKGYTIHTCEGNTYELPTLTEFRDKLVELRREGINVPEQVFTRVEYELNLER